MKRDTPIPAISQPHAGETDLERRARILTENDLDLLWELVAFRRDRDITQQDVADALGVAQATIAAFERQDNDPKLSSIRRYALAVGALVEHRVVEDVPDATGIYLNWYRHAARKPTTPVGVRSVKDMERYRSIHRRAARVK